MRVLIVGKSSAIGKAIGAKLEARGDEVVVVGRELPKLEGEFQGMVFCPGTANLKPFQQMTAEDFRADWEINVLGAFQAVQSYWKQISGASIVFFSTVAVETGMAFHASVAAAKGAVEGFARALAAEMAPMGRVNVIAPSLVETPLTAHLIKTEQAKENIARRHALQRIGQPEDVAAMAAFLLSTEASWITGQVLHVDGGMSTLK